MAVVLGTSAGFVTTAPSADPGGGDTTIDGSSVVVKDTSPVGAYKITQIGWYRGSGTNTANFEIALYADGSGVATTRLFVDATNSTSSNGWVTVAVDWDILPSTPYWLGLQMDSHTGSSTVDNATSGGSGSDVRTSQTTLNNPYGGGAVADADGMYAIYALVNKTPTVALNSPADASSDSDTTPTLDFTGTDPEGDSIEYEVQIDTVNTFDSQGVTYQALSLNDNGVLYDDPSESTSIDNISFFCWVKLDQLGRGHSIWMNGHSGAFGQGYLFGVDTDDTLFIDIAFVAGLSSSLTISDNDWHFVGFQRASGTWTLYLDGSSESVGTNSPFSIAGDSLEVVGGSNQNGTATAEFEGEIALLGYWEAVLTSGEIASLLAGALASSISTGLVVDLQLGDDTAWGTNPGADGDFTTSGTLTEVSGPSFGGPLIDAVSETDAGFVNPDTGGDTHPFNSGENIQYTVQGGDALVADTYYWRVRGIDTAGTNVYGAWSSTRSFTTAAESTGNFFSFFKP